MNGISNSPILTIHTCTYHYCSFYSQVKLTKQTCLVISPLRSLMKDQVGNIVSKGIKAVAITKDAEPESISCKLCLDEI